MKAPQYGHRSPRTPRPVRHCLVCGEPVGTDRLIPADGQTTRDERFCSRACRLRYRGDKPTC